MNLQITEKNRKGDFAELYAITWLWDNGYEVFKNVGCTGIVDLIAIKDGETKLIDVKTETTDSKRGLKRNKSCRSKEQIEKGVQLVMFNPDHRSLRFVAHKQ